MMMANYKIPVRFKSVADVFDCEVARARARLCGSSSGSEHYSPDNDQSLTDLSDLVNSFLERECNNNINLIDEERDQAHVDDEVDGGRNGKKLLESEGGFSEERDVLRDLFGNETDTAKRSIREAVEDNYALPEIGSFSSPDFKRRLMSRLRRRGFDAGICKSKWEKSGHCPSGTYEYIDVLMSGNRYIIEVCLAKEFDIAKPTSSYSALLKMFPQIVVCKKEELKQVTRLMCKSIKKSMKNAGLSVPPWRRLAYTQAKWFSPYKRTLNEFPTVDLNSPNSDREESLLMTRKKRSVGFRPVPAVPFLCREAFFPGKMLVPQVGNLALALNEKDDDQ